MNICCIKCINEEEFLRVQDFLRIQLPEIIFSNKNNHLCTYSIFNIPKNQISYCIIDKNYNLIFEIEEQESFEYVNSKETFKIKYIITAYENSKKFNLL
jgi:hypothetical protein